ncbi:hypothetical protein D9M73_165960 [compost metagenome]
MRGQFAEAGHQEEHHHADQRVGQQRTARACGGDGAAGGDEQAGADRTADGDHVQVTGFQRTLEVRGSRFRRHREGQFSFFYVAFHDKPRLAGRTQVHRSMG